MNKKLLKQYKYLDRILQVIYDAGLKTLPFYSLFDKLYGVNTYKSDLGVHYDGVYTKGMSFEDFFNKNFELDSEDFRLKIVLEYLLDEELIKKVEPDSFKITYKGTLQLTTSYASGYSKLISDEKRLRKLEENQKRTNTSMVILTVVLALGTVAGGVYSVLQIRDYVLCSP